MISSDRNRSLPALLGELVFACSDSGAFVLKPGDPGLLRSLNALSANARRKEYASE